IEKSRPILGGASTSAGVHTFWKDSAKWSALVLGAGSARMPSSLPYQSVPLRGPLGKPLKVDWLLYETEPPKVRTAFSGNSLVRMSTDPPAKSPGRSGVAVLLATSASSRLAGNTSSGTTFLSGSGLAISAPLSTVLL